MFCADKSIKKKTWQLLELPEVEGPAHVDPLVVGMAAARGIEDLQGYFAPKFAKLMPQPGDLRDLAEAVERFCAGIEAGETIGIIGDYDVDGATSTALMVRALGMVGHKAVSWRIPKRIEDGYGPNERIVDDLRADGVSLLLVLDSGTAALDPLAHARRLGMDVLILDHHEPGDALPDALLVNPKRRDEDGGLAHLCSVGLSFVFAVAVVARLKALGRFERLGLPLPDLRRLLGLVALGTVADVVPLVGLNRAFVAIGLGRMGDILGLQALLAVNGQPGFTTHGCGFVFGPCINAVGRIENMDLGVELLLTEDGHRADELARHLFLVNQERQQMQKRAIEDAKQMMVSTGYDRQDGVIVLYSQDWHPGIVGLVASKIRELYDRPTAIIGDGGKGSARSVDGFHFGAAIIEATGRGLLAKGGGHAAAAGFTAHLHAIEDLRRHLDAALAGYEAPPVKIDLAVEPGGLDPDRVRGFSAMEPFGMGNPRPRVALVGGLVRKVQVIKDAHVKAWVNGPHGDTTVMLFNGIGTALGEGILAAEGHYADFLGTLDINEFRGVESVYLKVEDLMIGRPVGVAAA